MSGRASKTTPARKATPKPQEGPQEAEDPLADLRSTEATNGPETGRDGAPDPQEPVAEEAQQADPLRTAVMEALGAASSCWIPDTGDAVFDSERATRIGDDLMAVITGTTTPVTDQDADARMAEMIAAWHADTPALGFLHNGGRCGCRYVAKVALGLTKSRQG